LPQLSLRLPDCRVHANQYLVSGERKLWSDLCAGHYLVDLDRWYQGAHFLLKSGIGQRHVIFCSSYPKGLSGLPFVVSTMMEMKNNEFATKLDLSEDCALGSVTDDDKRLLRKIDRKILPIMFLTYFLQMIDKISINVSARSMVGGVHCPVLY
jgi:hypothetical protein